MCRRFQRATDTIESLLLERGLLRARDLDGTGVSRAWLERCVEFGYLAKLGRGLYGKPGRIYSPMVIAAARAPGAVVCLRSALHFHGLAGLEPPELWLSIHRDARPPAVDRARFIRTSGPSYLLGVERWRVTGVPVRITSVAKTLVDCFRFRELVGEQTGPDALDAAIRAGRCAPAEVLALAKACRIWNRLSARMWSTPVPMV